MGRPRQRVGLYLALALLAQGPLIAQDIWAVIASSEIDRRLVRQLSELATQHNAEARVVSSPEQANQLNPKLSIELSQEKDLGPLLLQSLKETTPDAAVEPNEELARQGYLLEATYRVPGIWEAFRIRASDALGFHNALLRVNELLRLRPSTPGVELIPTPKGRVLTPGDYTEHIAIADYPSFPERGIVEGFYGVPWSHQDRLDILRFEGQHRMNVYYYAPKDDPYHRKLWREPYPPEQMRRLGELVDTARASFVDFCFAISPGLSIAYSSDQDFATLTTKLDSVVKLGVSCFALFLDDVPQDLENAEDKGRFKTLAAAHVYLSNKLYDYLQSQSPKNRLTVTPTTYTNEWGSRDYIRELGAGVNPDVAIVWTGPYVVSPTITVSAAKEWGELLRRPPLVWDNFPVNDGIPWRLNLGPLVGRDQDLPTATRGLLSNPMNQSRASMIPLETVGDYLWNAAAYDPVRYHRKAITEQYGAGVPLVPFLKTYGDYWWQENIFKPLFVEERRVIDTAQIERAIAELGSSLANLRNQARFQKLVSEIAPFPRKTRERLATVRGDPAFRHLADGKLQWREDYDMLSAARASKAFKVDGNFAKWRSRTLYALDRRTQIAQGGKLWKGPRFFSARVGLAWDENYLYVGVDVTNRRLDQQFFGRGIEKGDAIVLTLETAFRKNFESTHADGDEYRLFFSPGNFTGLGPSVFSDEDYLPPRPQAHDYQHEIKTAWKKTPRGFSGEMAIPASYFDAGSLHSGYEIGLTFAAQKVFHSRSGEGDVQRIVFTSKKDRIFPLRFGNPSTYQRLVLVGSSKPRRR